HATILLLLFSTSPCSFTSVVLFNSRTSILSSFFFLFIPRPPRSTLFPYTTLFRSFTFTPTGLSTTGHVTITARACVWDDNAGDADRKSTRLNSSHQIISYAVFCLKKKKKKKHNNKPHETRQ